MHYVIQKITSESDLGFRYGWSTTVTVEEVAPSGPATQILQPGDRIVKVSQLVQLKLF